MQVINCLNLCEILPYLKQHKEIHEIIEEALTLAGYKTVERIYLGSSFCGKYFLMQSENDLKEIDEICRQYKMKITLVVPVFSESDLERGKKKIQEILGEYCEIIDEVTVNDYAMAIYIHEKHKININLGRMFMKDYRDPRYDEYFEIPWKPKMFTDYLFNLFKTIKSKDVN